MLAAIAIVGGQVAIRIEIFIKFFECAREFAPLGTLGNLLVVLNPFD